MKQLDKKGWKRVRFGDVCRNLNVTVKSPEENGYDKVIGLENIESGNLHIKTWGDIAEGTTFTKTFEPGHVLFGKRRAYLKKAAMAEFKGLCSGDILVFEAINKVLHPKLLPFIVSSDRFFEYAVKTSAGSLSPRTKFQDLANFEFYLPPIDQQEKLAELLWAGNDSIKKSILLFENILISKDSFTREAINNTKIKICKVGDLFRVETGSKNAQDAEVDGRYPFFTRSLETQKINTFSYDQEGLILPGEGNYQIKYYNGKFEVHQRTYLLTPINSDILLTRIYKEILQTRVGELLQNSVGSTVNSLRKPIIENISIPLPDLSLQRKILDFFINCENTLTLSERQVQNTLELQKNMIDNIFN